MRHWVKLATGGLIKRTRFAFASISQLLIWFLGATTDQLKDMNVAFSQLRASTPTEDQARVIYGSLVAKALVKRKRYLADWLLMEVQFEAFAAATGDREWAARMDLELGNDGTKEEQLLVYQERLARTF